MEVHTDHKPLEIIFKKPLNKAPARLQRMMMHLQRYQFKVIYKKGTSLYIADTFSRAALPTLTNNNVTGFEVFRLDVQGQYAQHHPNFRADTETKLCEETAKDPVLKLLQTVIMTGWPNQKNKLDQSLFPYWNYRDELSSHHGLIYKRTLSYDTCFDDKEILTKIHKNHFSAASSIRMAKDVFFWHGMGKCIKDMCDSCSDCAKYQKTAPKEPMKSFPIPNLPWQIVSQEYCQNPYLETVCNFSDWIEIDLLTNTLSQTIIDHTKAHFARYGGPQFICKEYLNNFVTHMDLTIQNHHHTTQEEMGELKQL